MKFNLLATEKFDRQLKRLLKKHPSLRKDLTELFVSLETDPQQGSHIGLNCYKIRLAIRSKNKGKSGGGRVITHVQIEGQQVYLLSIYDKAEKENLAEGELEELLGQLP